jgi:hypothetical protein
LNELKKKRISNHSILKSQLFSFFFCSFHVVQTGIGASRTKKSRVVAMLADGPVSPQRSSQGVLLLLLLTV